MCELTPCEPTLKTLLADCRLSQRKAAVALGVSAATLNLLVKHGVMPKTGWPGLRAGLTDLLMAHGQTQALINFTLDALEKAQNAPEPAATEEPMILRKQTLTMQAQQVFGLYKNPFADPESLQDVYLSSDIRPVREKLYQAATGSGFLAVIGESGSGKSTLKDELISRISAENLPVVVIEPYTLAMAETESEGKPLRSSHITEAILSTVAPGVRTPSSPEMRFRRMHQILKESYTAGMRHCLIIEEAHDLHRHTLKSLKRFWELKNGLTRLLSIILIGQTELGNKMQVKDATIREVTQRCEVIRIGAIRDTGDFLRHRFGRAGADFDKLFAEDALDALQERLTVAQDSRGRGIYMGYPLMIGNLAIACLNLAAEVGAEKVTADVVRTVQP